MSFCDIISLSILNHDLIKNFAFIKRIKTYGGFSLLSHQAAVMLDLVGLIVLFMLIIISTAPPVPNDTLHLILKLCFGL